MEVPEEEMPLASLPVNLQIMKLQEELAKMKRELAKKDEKLAEKDEKLAEKDEKLAKKDEETAEMKRELAGHDAVSIRRLLHGGLNDLILGSQKTPSFTNTSTHNSGHAGVMSFVEQDFVIFKNIEMRNLSTSSIFLLRIQGNPSQHVFYSNEAEIEEHVRNIMLDVLTLLDIKQDVSLHYQKTLMCVIDGKEKQSKSDIWVVKTQSGVPIAVIEVQQPGKTKLSNLKVLGQLHDYMSNLRNSFGQCEVFGIVTTLDKWRVVWFPDTNAFATSIDLNPPKANNVIEDFPVESTLQRTLHGSREYSWHDATLLPLIGTVILKSMRAQYRRVPHLSLQRAYTFLSAETWHWGIIPENTFAEHQEIFLTLPQEEPPYLIVLRQFHGGADGKVCLALTKDFHLVVLKKFYDASACEKEYNIWKTVYGVDVLRTRVVCSDSLIMPFVFHCIHRNGSVSFDFNMLYWGRGEISAPAEERFDAWTSKFEAFMETSKEFTVRNVLYEAVETLSEKSLVHNDIEWRHVALLPVLGSSRSGNSETVLGMKPVLIDLASVSTVTSPAEAHTQMMGRVNELLFGDLSIS